MSSKPLVLISKKLHLNIGEIFTRKNVVTGKLVEATSLPSNIDVVISVCGLGICVIDVEDDFKRSLKRVFKNQYLFVNMKLVQCQSFIRLQDKVIFNNLRTMIYRDTREFGLLVERMAIDLTKVNPRETITDKDIFKPAVIRNALQVLPVSEVNISLLLEAYENLFQLATASAEDIMQKTPLSAEDAMAVEAFFTGVETN